MEPSVSCFYKANSITLRVTGAFNRQAGVDCMAAYDRVPCAWRKQLIVILDRVDKVEGSALEALLYFCERSLNPHREIRLVQCDPLVTQVLRGAGLQAYYSIHEEPLRRGGTTTLWPSQVGQG